MEQNNKSDFSSSAASSVAGNKPKAVEEKPEDAPKMPYSTVPKEQVVLPRAESDNDLAEVQRSIKDIRLSDGNFDFSNVSSETNEAVITRVSQYCKDNPTLIEHLPDGSIYYGQKHSG